MANITVANANPPFPAGTSVHAYLQKGFPVVPPQTGAPAGTDVGNAVVAASGALTIAGAELGNYYLLAAEVAGAWRYLTVYLELPAETQGAVVATTLLIKEGANQKMGTATLNGTTNVVVANTSVTANSKIFLQRTGAAANAGVQTVVSLQPGVSFTIVSSNAADLNVVNYLIIEPA